ncbi:MAG: DegT/DnrJ/EryC1/StrS family aminotransferase, partial [Akkermansiaceae bacterium]|nr:DegT/DnrJ/EryC1/StrS family aminotransferase [Akkermansiaceae bacterium]
GPNSRLDEIQAAFLRAKLPVLDADNRRRREIAARYREGIRHPAVDLPRVCGGDLSHVWHLFVVRTSQRDSLQAHLAARGIGTQIHYPVPPHHQTAYRSLFEGLSPVMADAEIEAVIAAVSDWPG